MQDSVLKLGGPTEIFASLEQVNTAISRSTTSEELLMGVLDVMLGLFQCDRAWLLYPCSPTSATFTIPMQRTGPSWPIEDVAGAVLPNDPGTQKLQQMVLDAGGPVRFDLEQSPVPIGDPFLTMYKIQTQLVTAIFPVGDQPWMLGIHHCASAKTYKEVVPLFQAVGRRIADGLTRHVALSELRRREEHFRLLVENAPEAIVLVDVPSGRFIDINPKAEELFCLSRQQLLATGPEALTPATQPDATCSKESWQRHIQAAMDGQVASFEWTFTDARNQSRLCELRLIKQPDEAQIRATITDIRARRQAEKESEELREQLVQAQKMEALGHLTGGIAHDFNNLLTIIIGSLELISDTETSDLVRDSARQIGDAAERARSLTHRLLAFARKQPLRPSVFDAGRLLRGMDEMLRRTLSERVTLEIVVSGGLWLCEADATQLESAILNLAINARDAMPDGGRLTIEASNARLDQDYADEHPDVRVGQYVLFSVTDSGIGIEPELLEKVFAPFYTTKGPGKGSGLGLSMVHGFVKQSGGHIKVYSEPGHGTSVKLYLPRAIASRATAAPKVIGVVEGGHGETVLLVEDDASVRSVVHNQLRQLGYQVLLAFDAETALVLLRSHLERIELILTDVILSEGMKGTELAAKALELKPNLPVVFMSGYTENAIIHNGRLDPGVELLEKPFNRERLARSLRLALNRSRDSGQ